MTDEAVAQISGPQQRLYLLPVFILPIGVMIAISLASPNASLAFPVMLAALAIAFSVYVIGMARWFVEVLPAEVRFRNRWRTESVPLVEVVAFEVVSVRGIPLLSDLTVVGPSLAGACVAMRLRSGQLVPLVAMMAEWMPGRRVAASYCAGLQAALDGLRSD